MTQTPFNVVTFGGQGQAERRRELAGMLRRCPVPDDELLLNVGLFLVPQTLSRILFMDFLYRQILEVQGIVMDLGTRWGQNMALFTALRGIYEPFNRLRKIAGFDSFEGFPGIAAEDGQGPMMRQGAYGVAKGYEGYMAALLAAMEQECPLEHIVKHEIVKGNATVEVPRYLERNPETVVALAYFDFDLYQPTKECLLALKDRLTRGSVLGFDELNDHDCPGETVAVMETLGLGRFALRRYRWSARTSYLVVDADPRG